MHLQLQCLQGKNYKVDKGTWKLFQTRYVVKNCNFFFQFQTGWIGRLHHSQECTCDPTFTCCPHGPWIVEKSPRFPTWTLSQWISQLHWKTWVFHAFWLRPENVLRWPIGRKRIFPIFHFAHALFWLGKSQWAWLAELKGSTGCDQQPIRLFSDVLPKKHCGAQEQFDHWK